MENFRELEKEFKTKAFSKKALQNPMGNNFVTDSSHNSDEDSDDDQYNYSDKYGEEDLPEELTGPDPRQSGSIAEDKLWLEDFLITNLKILIAKCEVEYENAVNKKVKGRN